ncbi:MAG: hypothetical protein FJZ90_04625 [Chloroflexi bacterium]|nr:hypothetical protein [Chloroflexota bacterium]
MANKRMLVFVGLAMVALCLLWTGPVLAQGPGAAQTPFEIRIEVKEDGGWVLPSFGGLNLGLNSENFEALSRMLNLGMAAPEISPDMVKGAMENDVKHLAVVKEGSKSTILINGEPLSALSIADPAIAGVVNLAPELVDLIQGINKAQITVLVLFPTAGVADLSARLEARAAEAPVNTIEVGSTMSPKGELISVGGIPTSELGMAPITIDPAILQQLRVKQLDANVVAQGLTLNINEAEWLRVDWDVEQLTTKLPALALGFTGAELGAGTQQVLDVATGWLADSQIKFRTYVADEPQEDPLRIKIDRPIIVEWAADNSIKVEGIPVANVAGLAPYRNQLQTAAVSWVGDKRTLFFTVNDTQMPYLRIGDGFLPGVAPVVGADSAILKGAESVLGNTGLTLLVMSEGGPKPNISLLDYDAAPGRRLFSVVPELTVSRGTGDVALFGATIPMGVIEGLTGLPISQLVRQNAEAYAKGIDEATVVFGPRGLTLSVNGGDAQLGWDNRLRDNLVDLAGNVLLGETEMDRGIGGALSTLPLRIEKRALRGFLGLINAFELGVKLELQDEPLPPGFLTQARLLKRS